MLLHVYRLHVEMRRLEKQTPMPWIEIAG
jgi:hypothetical protein